MAAPTLRLPGMSESLVMSGRVGDIIMRITDTPPKHTLECNGAAVSREAYAKLFAEIGTSQGTGDGATTFNLPYMRNIWVKGNGDNAVGTNIQEGLPNISGIIASRSYIISNGNMIWAMNGAFYDLPFINEGDGAHVAGTNERPGFDRVGFSAANSNSIYGASDHVTPASMIVMFCIIYE